VIKLSEWIDPVVIIGSAQVFLAFVLAIITLFLWKSTDKYAKLTERDLNDKEIIRQIERLNKEMDNIIGKLNSELGNPIYFNPRAINLTTTMMAEMESDQKFYSDSDFWRDIKKNLYLTTPETRKEIKDYLDIKLGIATFGGGEANSSYRQSLKKITDVVEDRHKAIIDELDKLDLQITAERAKHLPPR